MRLKEERALQQGVNVTLEEVPHTFGPDRARLQRRAGAYHESRDPEGLTLTLTLSEH